MQNTIPFVVSPRAVTLSHRNLASTRKSRDNCRALGTTIFIHIYVNFMLLIFGAQGLHKQGQWALFPAIAFTSQIFIIISASPSIDLQQLLLDLLVYIVLRSFNCKSLSPSCSNPTFYVEIKCQLDATEVFIADLIACTTCFGHHYAHHQELKSIIQWLLPVVFGAVKM